MHILFIVPWYKSLNNPLSGPYFETYIKALNTHNINVMHVELKSFSLSSFLNPDQFSFEIIENINVIRVLKSRTFPFFHKTNYQLFANGIVNNFQKYIDKFGVPNLIHAQIALPCGFIASFLSRRFNIPYLITEHFSGFIFDQKYRRTSYYKMIKFAYENCNKLIVVSNFLKDQISSKYNLSRHIDVIYNPVDNYFLNQVTNKNI